MRKFGNWAAVGMGLSLAAAPTAMAKMIVVQLSSGADGQVLYEVTSDATLASGGEYALIVHARGTKGDDLSPIAAVDALDCGDNAGCLDFGMGLADPSGDSLYFGAPFTPGQPVEVTIPVGELCYASAEQTGGLPPGCSADAGSAAGYVQKDRINLSFGVYPVGPGVAQIPQTALDQSQTVALDPVH